MAVLEKCPICDKSAFTASGQTVSLPDTLRRWEEVIGRQFPERDWSAYRQYQPLELKECAECGFGRFEPVVSGSAGFYEFISAVDYYNEEKWEFDAALNQLQLAGAKRILDVGCGSGIFLDYLRRQMPDAQLFGYDLNAELLASLAARGLIVLSGDLGQIKAKARSGAEAPFDAICMLQVLEHASDPIDMLQTFLGLLRPGGLLIVTTPDAGGPIKNFPDALTEIPPHHVTRWTKATFEALFKRLNLKMNCVQHEPLPEYLWDAYLPVMWDEPIWPARIFDPLAKRRGLVTVGERSGFAAKEMKEAGIRRLYGVPGHTIFVAATSERG